MLAQAATGVARTLLARAFDYAGLFPPASLPMRTALAEYRAARAGRDAWALGRFVVPAGRLDELREAAGSPLVAPLPLAVLLGDDVAADAEAARRWERASGAPGAVEAVELRAATPRGVREALAGIPPGWPRYVEVVPAAELGATLDAVQASGAFAKLRMGGVTPEAFPAPAAVLAFLDGCVRRRLPFKATAGLHHPLRGSFRLTYDAGSAAGPMYGYMNLFLAAAVLRRGGDAAEAEPALLEGDPAAFTVQLGGLGWRGRRFSVEELAALRETLVHGIGSCSFREPMDELPEALRA